MAIEDCSSSSLKNLGASKDTSLVWSATGTCLLLALVVRWTRAEEPPPLETIRRIDVVHTTHTDIGFTDHPLVCREQQVRYLDIAIDAVLVTCDEPAESQFYWTAETTLAVDDWWQAAADTRREDLLRAIDTGRLEIAALAMNQTPTLNPAQWRRMLRWLPDDVWKRARPRVAIQNDVNGFPRAGAVALLDRGVRHLFMGINATNGGPPFDTPTAFWWKMPDGRRMFVWLGDHYARGFYYFHPDSWRRGPVPEATDTRYRPARPGDFFRDDEASVRAAHAHLLGQLHNIEARGYDFPSLVVSVTNEWRMDNDPPFPPLADFVSTWNRLGLTPKLHLSTAADALDRMQREIGDRIAEYEGEWTDWWANGCASGPREVAASRRAKRLTAAALSTVWGEPDPRTLDAADTIYRDLCLFDEHTWGSSDSVARPHSLETWGQYNEKARMAHRPLALAKLLLSRRARTAVYRREEGLFLANAAMLPWSGWVTMPASCLRGDFRSLKDPKTGELISLVREHGYQPFARPTDEQQLTIANTSETFPDFCPDQQVRFWLERIEGLAIRRFLFSDQRTDPQSPPDPVQVVVDERGWPLSAQWPGMEKPLFEAGTGDFLSVAIRGFAPRWIYSDILASGDSDAREQQRRQILEEVTAVAKQSARVEQNAHTAVYEQVLEHPRLRWLTRRLELWNREPRARLTVRLHRTEFEGPELFFVTCALPTGPALPETSNGGLPFVPYEDQLPGTCRDYFSIDSWARYPTAAGQWLWVSRDAPLITFGDHQVLARRSNPPERPNRILAMVFNNVWFTNFVADSHGALEFQFDIDWQTAGRSSIDAADRADTLLSEPQVVINPDLRPSPIFLQRLHRP